MWFTVECDLCVIKGYGIDIWMAVTSYHVVKLRFQDNARY